MNTDVLKDRLRLHKVMPKSKTLSNSKWISKGGANPASGTISTECYTRGCSPAAASAQGSPATN